MIKNQKKINSLICLIIYWSLIISTTIFLAVLGVAVFFSLINSNALIFDWLSQLISAVRKGIAAGSVLGIGIWIKAKMEENKRKKSPPTDPEP